MTQTLDPTAPELLRPTQEPCPLCQCCTAVLCERGRADVGGCMAHTPPELSATVAACLCSAPATRGTHAWRAEMIRITKHATESPMPAEAEEILRALTGCEAFTDDHGFLRTLRARGYVTADEQQAPRITNAGRRYITARTERRFTTPVEVESVDVRARTARVVVVGWHIEESVTVLLDQLTTATGLTADGLVNRFLEARANCYVNDPDDLVLTRFQIAPPLPAGWMGCDPC
ncbi:hypothetical protein [[Kitasatospora] papulosa]|uniref:hypothetical protein n=1 Tax=[Kitasatospora] papulosa TaxID=1464011 RepID=UPI00367DCB7B